MQPVIEFPAIVHWHTIRPCSLVLIFNSPATAAATARGDKGVVTVASPWDKEGDKGLETHRVDSPVKQPGVSDSLWLWGERGRGGNRVVE